MKRLYDRFYLFAGCIACLIHLVLVCMLFIEIYKEARSLRLPDLHAKRVTHPQPARKAPQPLARVIALKPPTDTLTSFASSVDDSVPAESDDEQAEKVSLEGEEKVDLMPSTLTPLPRAEESGMAIPEEIAVEEEVIPLWEGTGESSSQRHFAEPMSQAKTLYGQKKMQRIHAWRKEKCSALREQRQATQQTLPLHDLLYARTAPIAPNNSAFGKAQAKKHAAQEAAARFCKEINGVYIRKYHDAVLYGIAFAINRKKLMIRSRDLPRNMTGEITVTAAGEIIGLTMQPGEVLHSDEQKHAYYAVLDALAGITRTRPFPTTLTESAITVPFVFINDSHSFAPEHDKLMPLMVTLIVPDA